MDALEINGVEVVRIDINGYAGDRFDGLLDFMGGFIRSKPRGSVRLLTIMHSHTPIFTDKFVFSEYLTKNKPHILASAYCGFPSILLPLLKATINFSGRDDIRFFENENEALEWLVSL